jgi:L-iditol 2-dehydrogenase
MFKIGGNTIMRVAQLYTAKDIRIEEVPTPEIGPHDILVQMKACGICTGDILPWYIEKKAPLVLGHEPAGVVSRVGKEVTKWKVGDRVFAHHHTPCMTCRACEEKRWCICPTWKETSLDPGGMAEYVRVTEPNVSLDTLKLPDSFSFEDGVLIEPTACSVQVAERGNITPNTTVAVIGLGVMGMLNLICAKLWGAKKVIGIDCVPWRLEKALEFGADEVINFKETPAPKRLSDITGGHKADLVVVGPGTQAAMDSAMQMVAKGGLVMFFTPTPPDEHWKVSPYQMYLEDITITTSYSCGPNQTRLAMSLIEDGKIPVNKLITHRFPLSETNKAYELMTKAENSLKAVVLFD